MKGQEIAIFRHNACKTNLLACNERSNHLRCSRCYKTNVNSYSDGCREQMKEPLLSSTEVAASASSSSVAKSSAEKPSDICAGAFDPGKEVIGLLPGPSLLKLSVTGLSEMDNAEGAGGLFEASSMYFPVSWCEKRAVRWRTFLFLSLLLLSRSR
jgi:hypothetical protein